MNEIPNQQPKRRWPLTLAIWLLLFAGMVIVQIFRAVRSAEHLEPADWWQVLMVSAAGASLWLVALGLYWFARWLGSWRNARRALIGLAVLATLLAIFHTEENWRGKCAWENCKRELEAKGLVMDWDKHIPPPVPDDQNFFKAPKMTEWFVGRNSTNDLYMRLHDKKFGAISASVGTSNQVNTVALAKEYLAWSDQFAPDFALLREALQRPYARMEGDYSKPYEIQIPSFVTVRAVAQTLAQRTHCYLLLNQPEKALLELALLNDSRRLLAGEPTGKPMTLVAAMVNVVVAGVYAGTLADGLQLHTWQEPQLVALQAQLQKINLPPLVAEALNGGTVASSHTLEHITPTGFVSLINNHTSTKDWQKLKDPGFWILTAMPRGWVYQNMTVAATLEYKPLAGFDLANNLILPQKSQLAFTEIDAATKHFSLWNRWASFCIPNSVKATITTARNQTLINEAQIVCALERHRLAHGDYPETLAALVPQFIEQLPHDIIGGQPLHYRRMEDGAFQLYSVGWNETDDGGVTAKDKSGNEDRTQGDWVWHYPLKW